MTGNWAAARPPWIEHGTVVICLGNTGRENTFLGKAGDGDIKGISAYLNKRLWTIPDGAEVYVQELRKETSTDWPQSYAEASGRGERRWNRRQIQGARHFVESAKPGHGELAATGTVGLGDGTELDWYLWQGDRQAVHSYAHKNGYIAALYNNELYDTQTHAARYRSFGITQASVRTNLTIVARPRTTDGRSGVYPDTARNTLRIQGSGKAGEPLPWAEWAEEFADNLPAPIREALANAAPANSGSISDPSIKARLVDRFGARWKSLRFVASPSGTSHIRPTESTGPFGNPGDGEGSGGGGGGGQPGPAGPQSAATLTVARKTSPSSTVTGRSTRVRGGLPDWEWTTMADIGDAADFIAAAWCPPRSDKPSGMVQLARDFPAVAEVKAYWRSHYADHHGDAIDAVIEEAYGEVMVARVAHSESLASHPAWGVSRINNELRSPVALTMSLLGLLAEDHVIASRLSAKLGKRRS